MKLMTLCYVKKNGKTLMLHVNKPGTIHHEMWNGLGGKFEPGETPEECIIREVFEESGLKIEPKLHGVIIFKDIAKESKNNGVVFVFTATKFTGELIKSPEGKLEWIKDPKLNTLKRHQADAIFTKWLNEEKFFSAKFTYNAEKLVATQVNFY